MLNGPYKAIWMHSQQQTWSKRMKMTQLELIFIKVNELILTHSHGKNAPSKVELFTTLFFKRDQNKK